MNTDCGFAIFEETVVGVYNLGVLNKKLLKALMTPYRGVSMGPTGALAHTAKDGKGLLQIVIEVWGLPMPKEPSMPYAENPKAWDAHETKIWERFGKITAQVGWGALG